MDSMSNKTNWNSSKILVNLSDDDTSCYNSQRLKYCQSITKEKICRETCGISVETSNNGICQWFVKDNQFSTCTVDSSTCPDSVCDALEELNKPIICPLDCLCKYDFLYFLYLSMRLIFNVIFSNLFCA